MQRGIGAGVHRAFDSGGYRTTGRRAGRAGLCSNGTVESLALIVTLIVGTIVLAGLVSAIALWRNPRHLAARIFFGAVAVFSIVTGIWLGAVTGSRGAWVIGGTVAAMGALSLWRLTRRRRATGAPTDA